MLDIIERAVRTGGDESIVVIREKIASGVVVYVSRPARLVGEKYCANKDAAEVKFRNRVLKLLDAGRSRCKGSRTWRRVRQSPHTLPRAGTRKRVLHRWMAMQVVEGLESVIHVVSSGEALPDVRLSVDGSQIATYTLQARTSLLNKFTVCSRAVSVAPFGHSSRPSAASALPLFAPPLVFRLHLAFKRDPRHSRWTGGFGCYVFLEFGGKERRIEPFCLKRDSFWDIPVQAVP